ncbi:MULTISPECIES: NAD(P)/FAD-dependent oxidoreductase [Streptomyces]|uniref:FAD-dependent oxidoreductase n=1 Tax=Streptomyces caniscabiei TaxID=2746961 RepID=A0ABU4N7X6_9ACTN|nr:MULTISPECIES: FAD-dependent oxidoreductase [Streptomyces]MBE4739307.1 FAD-dependent oxidoreductase [Streptomyces caniscabiei]MBE4758690.1 FAD-dependent oxidoreductase [Streptomyces caniscabiei]MBE4771760.1 FAD-dependent oxidoreductase [Streptomyces caniscabiei]MBE4787821.1 FAD-dependent oxidoreductase [Streptomyces caniscabiei]MBE4797043.1 FAD-dependent oxidoreductase [Streptomyces caniscabiei]
MQHRIVVLGAGYTGAGVAGRLAKRLHRADVAITLVNAESDFIERVRMHQLAVGQELRSRPFDEMFAGTGVEVKLAEVAGVDADRRTVTVTAHGAGQQELAYDTLVYALGSGWNPQGVPGTAEHAHEIAGRAGALRLRERLARLDAGQPVVIVGGGLTGLEAATEIAETRPDLDVALVARGGFGDWLSDKGRAHLRKVCAGLGITVHEHTAVTAVEADRVLTDGTPVPAAVTVWATGFAVHPIAEASTLEVSGTGQIVVDGTMRSVSHPEVYAVGDAALVAGPGDKPLRMSCASGVPTAWQAADAIAARLTGGKLPKIEARYYQQCISLGRKEGLIQFVTADDQALPKALTGRIAAVYKEIICKGAAWAVAHPTVGMPVRRRRTTQPAQPTLTARATSADATAEATA